MKNLLIIFCFFGSVAYGQSDSSSIKPVKGDWAVEMASSLNFRDGSVFTLNGGPVEKLIQSISDSGSTTSYPTIKARRFIKSNVAERFLLNISMNNSAYGKTTNSEMGVSIGYGREKHFKGTRKLSTYIGWDLSVGVGALKQGKDNLAGIVGKINLLSGADYYIAPKLYVGAELGLAMYGYSYGSNPTISLLEVGISANPQLRIGYRF
jgi:hypothetical protein